jgi:hypothetical protein
VVKDICSWEGSFISLHLLWQGVITNTNKMTVEIKQAFYEQN